MTAHTYGSLESELINYNKDDDPEFASQIPNLIMQGQTRIYGDLQLDTMQKGGTVTILGTDTIVATPSDCISVQEVRRGVRWGPFMKERTVAFVNTMQQQYPEGDPIWWAMWTATAIIVAPRRPFGAADLSLFLRHSAPEETLDPQFPNSSTWVSENFGDLLLYSCLWATESFNKHAEGEQLREAEYVKQLARANAYLEGRRRVTARV